MNFSKDYGKLGGPSFVSKIILPCAVALLLLACASGIAFADHAMGDEFKLRAPDVYEHLIDFMVSLQLALFAVVGFFGRTGFVKDNTWGQIAAAFVFVGFGVASLYFAYQSHLEIMVQLASGVFAYGGLTNYVWEAWSLLASAIATFVFVAFALLE